MLVLTRKPGEKIVVDGGIVLTVLEVRGNKVRLGIEAPVGEGVTRRGHEADGFIGRGGLGLADHELPGAVDHERAAEPARIFAI